MKDIACLICSNTLSVRIARGRKSNKPFIMMICPKDGRHFRAFVSDQTYVQKVIEGQGQVQTAVLEGKGRGTQVADGTDIL